MALGAARLYFDIRATMRRIDRHEFLHRGGAGRPWCFSIFPERWTDDRLCYAERDWRFKVYL